MNNTCLLIPALEPQEHFIDYVKKLKSLRTPPLYS